ncbi:MAG: hypothetical protein LBD94_01495, partial [Rickettsiales bacterium]|nr:hypothetical protein [Rickettsiales bacterium]
MKKTLILVSILLFAHGSVFSAAPRGGRGGGVQSAPAPSGAKARAASTQNVVSIGASAPKAAASAGGGSTRSSGTRSSPASTASAPKTSGGAANSVRAAATQSVIQTGSAKIAGAASNAGIVDEECKSRYFGCMDSFCMQDNANGARCICSDQVKTYDSILSEIEKLDAQSLKLATDGVSRIDMGEKADEVDKIVNSATSAMSTSQTQNADGSISSSTKKSKRRTLDMDAFDKIGMEEAIIEVEEVENDPLEGLTGNALHDGVRKICVQQVGIGCEKDIKMLQMMYSTQIKSDCSGYELELKKRRTASSQKLATAQRAMKEAALEKFDEQNKYDLGQCIIEMRKCVATTGGCGDDFTKCTFYNTGEGLSGNSTPVNIPGASTTIKVGQGTLDNIQSKRKLCEATVTKNCVSVRAEVWPSFLVEIAPALKAAELLAEDSSRQSILENISACFQKACASKFDPKQAEDDYDACLGNPELMRETCKVVLEQAGIPISEVKNTGSTNPIWKFVVAKLAAMRVDACTTAIKNALEDETACGKGFVACLSGDAQMLREIIPPEKLVSCAKDGQTV